MENSGGTLDYLKRFRSRRGGAEETVEVIPEQENAPLSELKIDDIKTLDQATQFFRQTELSFATSLFKLSHALKKVRDEKMYLERYDSFDDYCENELNYKRRSVYNFLKIADNYPLDTKIDVQLAGVRKLLALTNLDEEERIQYIENNDILGKSSAEIVEEVKTIKSGHDSEDPFEEGEGLNIENMQDSVVDTVGTICTISTSELGLLKKFYKKMDGLYTVIEKFKNKQEDSIPFSREELIVIKNQISELDKEKERLLGLINKYVG